MSVLEETFEAIVRKVVREELAAHSNGHVTELLTAREVAKLLSLNRHGVYDLKREGKLKAVMTGERTYRFAREEVDRFIRERTG